MAAFVISATPGAPTTVLTYPIKELFNNDGNASNGVRLAASFKVPKPTALPDSRVTVSLSPYEGVDSINKRRILTSFLTVILLIVI